jgi:hypothetical protein
MTDDTSMRTTPCDEWAQTLYNGSYISNPETRVSRGPGPPAANQVFIPFVVIIAQQTRLTPLTCLLSGTETCNRRYHSAWVVSSSVIPNGHVGFRRLYTSVSRDRVRSILEEPIL